MPTTFFERAAEDLLTYKNKVIIFGSADPVFKSIEKAIASGNHIILGMAYLNALTSLNSTNSGHELVALIFQTLTDISQGKVDAGDFQYTLSPQKLSALITENITHTLFNWRTPAAKPTQSLSHENLKENHSNGFPTFN